MNKYSTIIFRSAFTDNIYLYANYDPDKTSLGKLISTLFDYYEIRETYIENYNNLKCAEFYSEELKILLNENDFYKRMSDFKFSVVSTIHIFLKEHYNKDVAS